MLPRVCCGERPGIARVLLLLRTVLTPVLLLVPVGLLSTDATSAPTFWPSVANTDPTPFNVDFYVKEDANECPIGIASLSDCNAAARFLGLPATAKQQTSNKEPKGCYTTFLGKPGRHVCRHAHTEY